MQKRQLTDVSQRGTSVSIVLCNAWNYSNRHTEMLKEKLVISLKTDLLGRYQAFHGSPVPETQLAHPVAPRAADSKGNISTCWFGEARTGSVQSVAGLMPAQLVQRAFQAQCLCNGQSAQAKYFVYVMT